MNKVNLRKKGLIGISLALALCVMGVGAHTLRAAGRVDTNKSVKITAVVSEDENSIFTEEYAGKVTINLYKIATLDETGKATLTDKFNGADIDLSILDKSPSVDDVKTEIVDKAITVAENLRADATISLNRGAGKTSESTEIAAGAGIYLYLPQDAQDESYIYKFTPYIVYAPTSDYILFGEGSDEWEYESKFILKSSEERKSGDLNITKTLTGYNPGLGEVAVVYKVKAVVIADDEEKVVLDKVVPFTFKDATSQTISIKDIPATAVVTVTEEYSGASYSPVGGEANKVKTTEIVAGKTASVEFINEYDGRLITGGISAENNFIEKDGVIYWIDEEGREIPQTEIAR